MSTTSTTKMNTYQYIWQFTFGDSSVGHVIIIANSVEDARNQFCIKYDTAIQEQELKAESMDFV